MTLIAEPASYIHRPELEEPAREAWKEARKWLEMDFDAKRLIGILDSRKDMKIAVVVKVQKTEMVDGSLYKYGDGTWSKKGYNGGAIYWWIQDSTAVEKPEKGLQDPRISLIHEMYHAWQCLYSRGCKDLQGLYAVGTDKWFEKQLRVEQACVNFEKEVAEGCGTTVREDYWHYKCRGAVCEFRRAFSKQLAKLKDAERYYCNSKNFTPTYELLTERYKKKDWQGGPFEPFPG
jgi:hypothetical protein